MEGLERMEGMEEDWSVSYLYREKVFLQVGEGIRVAMGQVHRVVVVREGHVEAKCVGRRVVLSVVVAVIAAGVVAAEKRFYFSTHRRRCESVRYLTRCRRSYCCTGREQRQMSSSLSFHSGCTRWCSNVNAVMSLEGKCQNKAYHRRCRSWRNAEVKF